MVIFIHNQIKRGYIMKCVKNEKGDIKRVSDEFAGDLVDNKGWVYVGKSEWKENVRDKKVVNNG